jgi:cation transport regulator ChaB
MTKELKTTISHEDRRKTLLETRAQLLAMAPEKALERILAFPQPAALVHAFPEEDLHFLVHDIGPQDALPLIALASGKQLEYLLDQEIWQRDRLHIETLAEWLGYFLQSDPSSDRMTQWLSTEKLELIEFFLLKSIEVRFREHDQDPSIFGPGFFTYDHVFYIRIIPRPTADTPDQTDDQHERLVKSLLDQLAEADHVQFQAILMEAAHVLSAEMEEDAYRQRNVRLAEKGFLPFEEAVGLYQPLHLGDFPHRAQRRQALPDEKNYHLSLVPMTVLPPDNLFSQALQTITSTAHRDVIQEEFAALCNRIIVADRQKITRRESLAGIVQKACGYLHIGLQRLQDQAPGGMSQSGANDLQRYHLEGVFRLGYDAAVGLKQAAEEWVHQSWFARRGLPLTFWGETWLGVIGGLLLKRPLFFDNYQTGRMYREFADQEDIDRSKRQLEQVQRFDHLLNRLDPAFASPLKSGFLSYKNLLLTLWVRHRLSLPEEVRRLTTHAFEPFFKELFQYDTAPLPDGRRRIDDALREDFLHWLADRTAHPPAELSASIGSSLEALFTELEEAYGRVHPEHIDPRYIRHFLLEPVTP